MATNILCGDAVTQLKTLPDKSVHCVVTSPPYWGLREYQGDEGMIGMEPTFGEHLEALVRVFSEVYRVLRDDGTLWLNYGDAYAGGGRGNYGDNQKQKSNKGSLIPPIPRGSSGFQGNNAGAGSVPEHQSGWKDLGLKRKNLMMMPTRVAMALQEAGWYLRQEIIWAKPNPMPESVKDRPTSANEKIFLFSKKEKYFYSAFDVRQKKTPDGGWDWSIIGANLRNVWHIPTAPFRGAHFATFPEKLVETCLRAGTSTAGACANCGAPMERELEKVDTMKPNQDYEGVAPGTNRRPPAGGQKEWTRHIPPQHVNWDYGRGCKRDCAGGGMWASTPCVVLDPFAGVGTVGLVADKMGRDSIMIEISQEYCDIAGRRIAEDSPMFADIAYENAQAAAGGE